jgi:hypothetical protein
MVKPGDRVLFKDYNGKRRNGVVADVSGTRIRLNHVNGSFQHKVINADMVLSIHRKKRIQQPIWGSD